jgi:hypothetical protein
MSTSNLNNAQTHASSKYAALSHRQIGSTSPLPLDVSMIKQLHVAHARVLEQVRQLQLTVSKMRRSIKDLEEDDSQWSIRYTRRIVVLTNYLLALGGFLARFASTFRRRQTKAKGRVLRSFHTFILRSLNIKSTSLASTLVLSALNGVSDSLMFGVAANLFTSKEAWKRNLGFILSSGNSVYLTQISSQVHAIGPPFHMLSLLFNVLYLIERYYFLHGLLWFGNMRLV